MNKNKEKIASSMEEDMLDLKNHCQRLIYESHIEFFDYCDKAGWNIKMSFPIYKIINRSCTLILDNSILTYWTKFKLHKNY